MSDTAEPKPILIAGPTASGKSSLALALAERLGGVIINADALQVYAEWRVLTARPAAADEARAPHRLYGHTPIADVGYSTGRWLREVAAEIEAARRQSLRPVIVGGTGLYFKALTQGLAEIPATPPEIRAAAEARLNDVGADAFAEELRRRDPASADRIDLANPRRVLRAIEVLETTGQGFAAWMEQTPPPVSPLSATHPMRLLPPREKLRARIATRFRQMMEEGAVDEVRAVQRQVEAADLPAAAPGLKALGYDPIRRWLAGELTRSEATEIAVLDTGQYAKRQSTWLRNQMAAWPSMEWATEASIKEWSAQIQEDERR
ncbi:MAG: tRNA (adenosine(37)-N6)-dimethylallyltransferase MiaA [Neomegalonema sp.]|nr:tRNA (adenosine(37)-N6)-dimethylallyltransferase MiaA [Neomegalonema sp.]